MANSRLQSPATAWHPAEQPDIRAGEKGIRNSLTAGRPGYLHRCLRDCPLQTGLLLSIALVVWCCLQVVAPPLRQDRSGSIVLSSSPDNPLQPLHRFIEHRGAIAGALRVSLRNVLCFCERSSQILANR